MNDSDGRPLGTVLRRRKLLCCTAAALTGLFDSARAAPWTAACHAGLPSGAQALVDRVFDGLDPRALWDMHTHLLGNGDSGSGCVIHPSLTRGWQITERIRHRAILGAACVPRDALSVDRAYVERLVSLAQAYPPGARWLLFAFEQAHDDAGRPDPARTTIHVPDAYAAAVAAAHPGCFGWVASIHPYRDDALARLCRARQSGAAAVKWLPSAMNIDLRDPRCRPFFDLLARMRLPLIVHCGEEKAVPGAGRDDLGNPLLVRAPLAHGVRVVVAHCASLGHATDLDRPSTTQRPAFELFARLMDERAHGDRLLGDISAVFQINRSVDTWRTVLRRGDWHGRLLHGSDYPLPALKPLTSLTRFVVAGLLDEREALALDALRDHHPLLFDLALKRSLRDGSARLSSAIFDTRRAFITEMPPNRWDTSGDTSGGASRHSAQTL